VALKSNLLAEDHALEACLISDPAHIIPGAVGDHVSKIQIALAILDQGSIQRDEVLSKRYGPSTAAAVLAFKRKRNIVNYSYETEADNIVGKMTIQALDTEMYAVENGSSRLRWER
jgi:peptidoglycan hydrolase-like protein with peptidoglycan-binding domain